MYSGPDLRPVRPAGVFATTTIGACGYTMAACVALAGAALGAAGQVAMEPADTTTVVADSGDVVSMARAAQARFERRRLPFLPLSYGAPGGECDERVGRFCTWYGEGEWFPVPEDDRIAELRHELLTELDSLQRLVPGDPWILGQRVWYRTEGDDWDGGLETAAGCGGVDPDWCSALEGFVLHGMGRYEEALDAFERALIAMDPAAAREWRVPRWPIDSDLRDLLEDADADPEAERRLLDRMWRLADPLYLVLGNDRLTAHYSRWTVAALRDRARNPFRTRWGPDLDQLTVRHGWELGWERSPASGFSTVVNVIGHKHPEGRDYMPPGSAVGDPTRAGAEELRPDRRRPRSLFAPQYAPVLLPMVGQIAFFPRGETTLIAASPFLPDDTTYHADHDHALPWMEAGPQAQMEDRVGLFAVPVDGGRVYSEIRTGSAAGALFLEVPTGDYIVSAESWSPARRRAGRERLGLAARDAPEDIATLSNLVLLSPSAPEPETVEEAVRTMLPQARIYSGQPFAIGWEVAGLGFRAEMLDFEVSVHRTDRGVLRRFGEFLRLADRPQPLALAWQEPGPNEPKTVFRYLVLDLPPLDSGEYEIRLVLSTADRSEALVTARFEVVERER